MSDDTRLALRTFLSHLTTEPGVYRMIDVDGNVLYVGKASNLKKRVSSYFTKQHSSVKTRVLVEQIHTVDVTVTRTETEAFLLESSLIKALEPKYNVLLRDDKSYPFIHCNQVHTYPAMHLVRYKKKPLKGDYFGPYPSVSAVRDTLLFIQKTFNIRNCSDTFFNARTRPCLQYQIKRCTAPCVGYITPEAYAQSVNDACRFLQGKGQQVLDDLAKRMEQAVQALAFEEAAVLRDHIKNLRLIQEQQGVFRLQGDIDVIVIAAQSGFACVQCVTIRQGEVIASQRFFPTMPKRYLEEMEQDSLWEEVFTAFIQHYYLDTPERIPAIIVTDKMLSNKESVEWLLSDLRHKRCQISINPRGTNRQWLLFALNNLQLALQEQKHTANLLATRYQSLMDVLQRVEPIERMECFDISHTQGVGTVASCVVFTKSGPLKRDYRRFNIQHITPGDDYAAMEQAILRRFKRGASLQRLPDVLIIDGGKGQVAAAKAVLEDLDIQGIDVVGIAKGVSRKAGLEQLLLPRNTEETRLPSTSPALHLLQHIRDEAHRFAITAHRKKRQTLSFESTLDGIEGIGPKRRQALLHRFGGMRELAKAPMSEIAKVHGISEALAERIYRVFH